MTTDRRPIVVKDGELQELPDGDTLSLPSLPTSDTGLSTGDLWIDVTGGSVIKVVP
jgi:hypothetical protein